MEIISGPGVVTHHSRYGLGLRTVTPFREMFALVATSTAGPCRHHCPLGSSA
jgi:hypothetical protein